MHISEAFVGVIPDNAHVNVLLGPREELASVFAQAIAQPTQGFVPFITVLRPNVMVKPATLFVNKVSVEQGLHAELTWGPAQAGVALGVHDAVISGVLPPETAESWLIIAAVWVNRQARDAEAILRNNRVAMLDAIRRALAGEPDVATIEEAAATPWNPFHGSSH